jgi:Zn-finger nucleic acid-binding protein
MEKALQSPASTRNLTCPACRAHSYRVVSSGFIAIDVCDICVGLYLDRGEATAYLLQTRSTTRVLENTTNAASNVVDTARILEMIFKIFH